MHGKSRRNLSVDEHWEATLEICAFGRWSGCGLPSGSPLIVRFKRSGRQVQDIICGSQVRCLAVPVRSGSAKAVTAVTTSLNRSG